MEKNFKGFVKHIAGKSWEIIKGVLALALGTAILAALTLTGMYLYYADMLAPVLVGIMIIGGLLSLLNEFRIAAQSATRRHTQLQEELEYMHAKIDRLTRELAHVRLTNHNTYSK